MQCAHPYPALERVVGHDVVTPQRRVRHDRARVGPAVGEPLHNSASFVAASFRVIRQEGGVDRVEPDEEGGRCSMRSLLYNRSI